MTINEHVLIELALQQLRLQRGENCPIVIGVGEANDGANVGDGEGEVYRDKTGVTLNFRTIKAGTHMTVETVGDTVVLTAAGGLTGPDPSTLRAIATYADLHGTLLYNNNVRIDNSPLAEEGVYQAIQAEDPDVPGTWRDLIQIVEIFANGSPGGVNIVAGDAANPFEIRALADPYIIAGGWGGKIIWEQIATAWDVQQRGAISSQDEDTYPPLVLNGGGTYGGSTPIYCSKRDPNGAILATPGSWCYRTDGVDSASYMHMGSGVSNDDWRKVALGPDTGPFGMAGANQTGFPFVSDAGGATINVAAGTGFARISASPDAELVAISWGALSGQAIPTNTIRYVGVEYNGGSPQAVIRTGETWNWLSEFRLATVVNQSGVLHILNNPQFASSFGSRIFERFFETRPLERANRIGGIIPSATGTRYLLLSAGEIYDGFNEFAISAIDTSGAGRFDAYYRDGAGGFTLVASQAQWDNAYWDDDTGTLNDLIANSYGIHWLYIEADGALILLYGRGQYNTVAQAEGASPPATVPLRITAHGRLLGRLIFQQGASSPESVTNVWDDVFQGTGTGDGDVFGPASATDEAIVLFDGSTGKLIKNSPARITDTTDNHAIQIQDTDTPATWIDAIRIKKRAANGTPGGMYVDVGDDNNPLWLHSSLDPLVSVTAGYGRLLHEKISNQWRLEEGGAIASTYADTIPVLELEAEGTNGAAIAIYCGVRDPEGNISAAPGSLYHRADGLDSRTYQHRGYEIGTTGWVEISTDPPPLGDTWEPIAAAEANSWLSVAYGGGAFVAISSDGTNRVMRSVDFGRSWSAVAAAAASDWKSVTYGRGVFVAVANGGTNRVMRSLDFGRTWATATAASANSWSSVAYGNGVFVAVSQDGQTTMRSTDFGVNWASVAATEDNAWFSVAYGNGVFVAVSRGGTNRVMRSTNLGASWSAVSVPDCTFYGVAYGDGVFVAVGDGGTYRVIRSTNLGSSWSAVTPVQEAYWTAVAYYRGFFVAVALSGTPQTMISEDLGETWLDVDEGATSNWYGIAAGNGVFASVAYTGTTRTQYLGMPEIAPSANFRAKKSSLSQALAPSTLVQVTYNIVRGNALGAFASNTFTVPTEGWYTISAGNQVSMPSVGVVEMQIISSIKGVLAASTIPIAGAGAITPAASVSELLAVGEQIWVALYQTASTAATITDAYSLFSVSQGAAL